MSRGKHHALQLPLRSGADLGHGHDVESYLIREDRGRGLPFPLQSSTPSAQHESLGICFANCQLIWTCLLFAVLVFCPFGSALQSAAATITFNVFIARHNTLHNTMAPRPRLRPLSTLSRGWQCRALLPAPPHNLARPLSTSSAAPADTIPQAPPQRWLSDLHARLGKCIMFGCSPAQVARAGGILHALATEWRRLSAGSEGFLTGGRRGLEGQQVVWGEQDSFQHVNNVQYVRWAESSRVNWATHFAAHAAAAGDPARARQWAELMTPRSVGLILKSIRVDYKFPMTYPDRVSVYHRLRHPPSRQPSSSSLILDAVIFSHRHRRVSARVEEDVVIYDYRAARKTEMPAFMRDVLEDTFAQQQAETVRSRRRIWDLIGDVERLEKETWDRPDAVEDIGGAAKAK